MFKSLKKLFSKPVSNDEKIVFERIASMLPSPLAARLLMQASAICKSTPNKEGNAMHYEVDMPALLKVGDGNFSLSEKTGIVDFAKIELRLFEQTQPFTLTLKDGIVYCLKLSPPIIGASDLQEFSVVEFSLL